MAILNSQLAISGRDKGNVLYRVYTVNTSANPTYETCCNRTVAASGLVLDFHGKILDGGCFTTVGYGSTYSDTELTSVLADACSNLMSVLDGATVSHICDGASGDCPFIYAEAQSTLTFDNGDGLRTFIVNLKLGQGYVEEKCPVDNWIYNDGLLVTIELTGCTTFTHFFNLIESPSNNFALASNDYFADTGVWMTVNENCERIITNPGSPGPPCEWDITYVNRWPFLPRCENRLELWVSAPNGFKHPVGQYPPCSMTLAPMIP